MEIIRVRGWEKFQHYKKRNPPWIKLHRQLLDDREWQKLGDFAARLLIDLWLLASESEEPGTVKMDSDTLAWRLRYDSNKLAGIGPALQELTSHGFIRLGKQVASKVLAARPQGAMPETETEERQSKARSATTRATWLSAFGKVWEDRFGGTPPFARMGKAFKPLCEKYGKATVLAAWIAYLEKTEEKYATAENFAQKPGLRKPRPKGPTYGG